MRTLLKSVTVFFVAFLVVLTCCFTVSAKQEEKVFYLAGCDESGEVVTVLPAFILGNEDAGYLVMTDEAIFDENAATYTIVDTDTGAEYPVEYSEGDDISDFSIVIFTFQEERPPEKKTIPFITNAYKDQIVDLVYLDDVGEAKSVRVKIVDAQEIEGSISLLTITGEDGNAVNVDIYFAPGALLDEEGDLVGIFTRTHEILALNTSQEDFYGNSIGSGEKTSGGDDSSSGKKISEDEPSRERTTVGGTNTKNGGNEFFALIVIAGILVAVLLIFVGSRKGKKKEEKKGTIPSESLPPVFSDGIFSDPVAGTLPAQEPFIPEEPPEESLIPKTQPVLAQLQKKEILSVIGTAGAMVGRVYTVGHEGLSFGRDPSCQVRFTNETKGVSRIHCRLICDGHGGLLLTDCNSTYGTYIKRTGMTKPIRQEPNRSVSVKKGDKFYLGSNHISFMIQ